MESGIHHGRLYFLHWDSQHLGNVHGHGGSGAADVGRPLHQAHGTVGVDTDDRAGRPGAVEPSSSSDAPAAIGAAQRRCDVGVLLRGLQGLHEADAAERRAGGLPSAFLGGVA